MPTRRTFLEKSTQLLAGTSLLPASVTILNKKNKAPSDTLVVGLIGCGGMGYGNLRNHLMQEGVECGGLCDVDQNHLERRANDVKQLTGTSPRLFSDFRELLDQQDIDAVIIGTPDHWHCLQTVLACEAGKDVYVEKPMANSIAECDLMIKAARHYNRVVQVGQQQRSGQHWHDVVRFVQNGELGHVRTVKVWANFNYGRGQERVPDSLPPEILDYNMYLGPAPDQPYNANRLHGGWRHQWDFGGGLLTDWGVHLLDIVLWAMEVDYAPKSVAATGGIYSYPDRAIETPDTLDVIYQLDNFTLTWEHTGGLEQGPYDRNYGIAFIGSNGTLVVNRAGWEVIPIIDGGAYKMMGRPLQQSQRGSHQKHATNFIESIKDRKDPACTVEHGAAAAMYAHLGNIAYRSQSMLKWDPETNGFVNNSAAEAFLQPSYRSPWAWPKI